MTRAERLEIAQFLRDCVDDLMHGPYAYQPDCRDHIAQLRRWIKLLRDET